MRCDAMLMLMLMLMLMKCDAIFFVINPFGPGPFRYPFGWGPSVIPSVQALPLSLWSRRQHPLLHVCMLLRLHCEGRGRGVRGLGPGVLIHCYMFAYYADYTAKGEVGGTGLGPGGVVLCVLSLFCPSVGALSLFIPVVGALFRLGCTQTCLLHIHSFFLASIFLLYGLFFFDFSASIFFVVRPICFVSAAFVTENF